jgi:ABC-type lipoprotein export system ATPase subunit
LLLITHDAALAAQCKRIVELKDGIIVGDRSVSGEHTLAQVVV